MCLTGRLLGTLYALIDGMTKTSVFWILLLSAPVFGADALESETSLGVAVTTGNSRSSTVHLSQLTGQEWGKNRIRATGRYLRSSQSDLESAKSWGLGLRYDRRLEDRLSIFGAQTLESDRFAAYLQRYNTDVGAGILIYQWDQITWEGEGGYRYMFENRLDESQIDYHSLRMASQVLASFNPRVTGRLWLEFMPNLTVAENWLLNAEASLISSMSERLSLRLGYGIRFDHQPNPGARQTTDTVFTTSLVAQW